ncbi:MAG TPA: tetratricopeptide repeat protein, partial [Gaiellales bacterium]|nr:tetratricopeptide repeat protein [Gaiellales bacterium]
EEAYRLGRAHLFLGQILLDQGRHDDATLQLDAATALMRTGGPTTELASLALERARAALMGSDPAAAAEAAREALDHTEASEPSTAGGAYALMARVALAQGRLEDARFLCGRALEMLDGTAGPQHRGDVLRVLAMVEQRAGDLPAALDALWRSANPAEHPPAHRYGANRRTLSPE